MRVDKINRYSSGLVAHKRGEPPTSWACACCCYPSVAFRRFYVGKRYFLNGWAGFFAARSLAFYAFLKYAKVLEAERGDGSARRSR